jgi:hypothetical protein
MKHDNNYLLDLFKQNGIEKGLDKIIIESVQDDIIKIILRTIEYSHQKLLQELSSRTRK